LKCGGVYLFCEGGNETFVMIADNLLKTSDKQLVGIDIGTTSICGAVIDVETGEVIHTVTEKNGLFIETEEKYEKIQSAEKIIEAAASVLNSLINEKTAAIGVTGQMHGIVYTNAEGYSVSPLYTWQDGRGDIEYKERMTYAEYLGSYTGYGNVTDFFNRQNGKVPTNATGYCTIQDYFVMRICGLKKALMHITDAASLGLFDLKNKKFNYDCNIETVDGYVIAGKYKGIPVSVAIGDNQASVLSSITENDVLINVGTGSQISFISDSIKVSELMETRPFFDGKYLIVGAALCGGRAYAILKDFYKKILGYVADSDDSDIYEIMGKMLEKAKFSLSVDTRFSGTRVNKDVKGSVNGITEDNFTPEALTKGVLDGMIDELLQMYNSTEIKKNGLVGSGNGIRKNIYLVETAERKLNKKMRIPKNTEEAAVGAAMYGGVSAGVYKNALEAASSVIKYM